MILIYHCLTKNKEEISMKTEKLMHFVATFFSLLFGIIPIIVKSIGYEGLFY